MKIPSAVLLLVGVLVCYCSGEDKCVLDSDKLPPALKANLNHTALVQNTWYEVKKLNSDYAKGGGCVSVNYTIDATNAADLNAVYFFYNNKAYENATYKLAGMTARDPTGSDPGVNIYRDNFKIHLENGTEADKDFTYRFLLTEYNEYLVVYGCHVVGTGATTNRTQKISILSTKQSIEARHEGAIELILQKLNVITAWNSTNWQTVEQNETTCKGSGSIFTLSTALSVIVAMLLVLRN